MPRQPRSPARAGRLPDGSAHPAARANALGPRHRNRHRANQNRTVAVDGNRVRIVPDPHPLSNVAATDERLTPPDSSDDGYMFPRFPLHGPPSPTGAVWSMETNNPEIDLYIASQNRPRADSPVSETTAVEVVEQIELVNTQALMEEFDRTHPVRRERFDPVALAALVSDPEQSDHSSDENSDEEQATTSTPQTHTAAPAPKWLQDCDFIDMEAEVDLPEEDHIDPVWLHETDEGESYKKFLAGPRQPPPALCKPAYSPKGKWAFAEGQDMKNVRVLKCLGEGTFAKAYLKQGELYGEKITFVSKEWNLSYKTEGLFSELALYMGPRYLKDLQGVCVPELIGLFRQRENLAIAFALPHADSWVEAHPDMPLKVKENIVEAYRKLHAKGILHGDVRLRHILVGDDHKVTLIDFNISRALSGQWDIGIDTCEESELVRELRQVKVKLRMEGAVENELMLIERYKELCVLEEADRVARKQAAKEARLARKAARKRKAPGDDTPPEPLHYSEMSEFSDDDGRQEDFVHGVDERLVQNEAALYSWLVTRDVSRRFVVPGRTPNYDSLPPFIRKRKEDEITRKFIQAMAPQFEKDDEDELHPLDPQPDTPLTITASTPPPAPQQQQEQAVPLYSIWSLPRRVIRKFNSCLSAIIPFSLTSAPSPATTCAPTPTPTQEPEEGTEERPRKRARI